MYFYEPVVLQSDYGQLAAGQPGFVFLFGMEGAKGLRRLKIQTLLTTNLGCLDEGERRRNLSQKISQGCKQ